MPELVYWRAVELKFITHLRTMCQTLCYFIFFPPYNNPTEKAFTPFFYRTGIKHEQQQRKTVKKQ